MEPMSIYGANKAWKCVAKERERGTSLADGPVKIGQAKGEGGIQDGLKCVWLTSYRLQRALAPSPTCTSRPNE